MIISPPRRETPGSISVCTKKIHDIHRRSHRTGCPGPDPTNFWDSDMGPPQNFVAKYWFTTQWTLPSFQPRRRPWWHRHLSRCNLRRRLMYRVASLRAAGLSIFESYYNIYMIGYYCFVIIQCHCSWWNVWKYWTIETIFLDLIEWIYSNCRMVSQK